MNKHTLRNWISNPWSISKSLTRRGLLDFLPDKAYLSLMYRANFRCRLNWEQPKTYCEKLQWLKLYDRNPLYSTMADKYAAKDYARERIGDAFVIPVLGGPWHHPDEIDFDALPDQFVLKTNHDCGGVLICRDKSALDIPAAKAFLLEHLQSNYYLRCREWPYKNIVPRIFAEAYLPDESGDLKDYKFFCFHGEPMLMFVASERQSTDSETKFDFYDMAFRHLPIVNGHPNSSRPQACPAHFQKMQALAAALSRDIPHVRVDFFEANGQVYLGELTFSHYGGFVPFEPHSWNETLGDWLTLPR